MIGAAGRVFELADLVAKLSSERRAQEGRIVVVLPLRPAPSSMKRAQLRECERRQRLPRCGLVLSENR